MPFLTIESLPEIARELHNAVQAQPLRYKREKEAYAFFYGAEDSYLVTSNYTALFAHSLLNGNEFSLEQVEQILREQLDKVKELRASGKTADVVVTLVGQYASQWKYAEENDPDAKACRERAKQAGQKWHEEGLKADEAFEQANKQLAFRNAEALGLPDDLLECLECGATYQQTGHVDAGGMGCDRCN